MKLSTSRIAAVVAVAGVVLFGATTATAGGSPTIPDGSVWQSDIAKPVNDLYLKTQPNTVGKAQLKSDVAGELALGKMGNVRSVGGWIDTHNAKLAWFTLPAGTWLLTTSATFYRLVGTSKTARPELALKYGEGRNAGTIAGVDISPMRGGKLAGATVQTVTVLTPTTVTAYGSGQNDDGSTFASGNIFVSAQITATRIG